MVYLVILSIIILLLLYPKYQWFSLKIIYIGLGIYLFLRYNKLLGTLILLSSILLQSDHDVQEHFSEEYSEDGIEQFGIKDQFSTLHDAIHQLIRKGK